MTLPAPSQPEPQQPQPYNYYAGPPTNFAPTNTMAILALVAAFIVPVAGIVLGVIAKNQLRTSGEQGAGLATAGIALGITFTALIVLLIVGTFAFIFGTWAFVTEMTSTFCEHGPDACATS